MCRFAFDAVLVPPTHKTYMPACFFLFLFLRPEDYKSAEYRRILFDDPTSSGSSNSNQQLSNETPPKMKPTAKVDDGEKQTSKENQPPNIRLPQTTSTDNAIMPQLQTAIVTYQLGLKVCFGGLIFITILLYYRKKNFVRRGLHKKV